MNTPNPSRLARGILTGIAVTAIATMAVGCSSGGSSTSSSSGGAANLTAAQAVVDSALAAPTAITQTEPLTKKPSPGKIVDLSNGFPDTLRISAGEEAAAKAVGWTYEVIQYDASSPASLQSALMNALTKNPTVVTESGVPQSQFGDTVLNAYKAAGVKLVLNSTEPVTADDPIIADSTQIPNGYAYNKALGKILADWFIVDSKGTGSAVIANVTGFPSLKGLPDGFTEETTANCPACKVDVEGISLADVNAGTNQDTAIAALRRNPDAGYLFFDNGAFAAGVDSKLAAAGLSNIIVGGIAPQPADVANLVAGGKGAWTVIGFEYTGWATMDLAYRNSVGMQQNTLNSIQPTQLFTSANATTGAWNLPADGLAQFEKLWQVTK